MKVRDVIKLIEQDGWVQVRTKGSHRIYQHPAKAGIVVIPGQPGKDIQPGTLQSILRQAGIK